MGAELPPTTPQRSDCPEFGYELDLPPPEASSRMGRDSFTDERLRRLADFKRELEEANRRESNADLNNLTPAGVGSESSQKVPKTR